MNREVPQEDLPQFADGGEIQAPVSQEVPQSDMPVPETDLPETAASGTPVPENDYGSLSGMAETAAEQFASGYTGGLSKVGETQTGITTPEAIKARAEANPITATTANVAGAIAPFVTPVIGPALKAATATWKGITALSAATALTNAAADDWSQNKGLDAQKAVSALGFGTLLGLGGSAFVKALEAAPSALSNSLSFLKRFTPSAEGDSYSAKMMQAFNLAGTKSSDLVNDMVDNYNTLLGTAKDAASAMWKTGRAKIASQLDALPLETAQKNAQLTVDKVEALTHQADQSLLSPTNARIVESRLNDLQDSLSSAKTASDVHTALGKFATDLDQGGILKFDTLMTASQKGDQALAQDLRSTVRSDLSDPKIWGEAGPTFGEVSGNYADFKQAQSAFKKAFTVNRLGSGGQAERVVDPSKLNSFFKNPGAPGSVLKQQALDEFTNAATKNASYASAEEGGEGLMDQVESFVKKSSDITDKASVLNSLKEARKGGYTNATVGVLGLAAIPIPAPLKAALFTAGRYGMKGGAVRAGEDIAKGITLAKGLASASEKTGQALEKGSRAIFNVGASQIGQNE